MTFEPFTAYWARCADDLAVLSDNPLCVAQWCYDHPPTVVHQRSIAEINALLDELRRNEPTLQPTEEP